MSLVMKRPPGGSLGLNKRGPILGGEWYVH